MYTTSAASYDTFKTASTRHALLQLVHDPELTAYYGLYSLMGQSSAVGHD